MFMVAKFFASSVLLCVEFFILKEIVIILWTDWIHAKVNLLIINSRWKENNFPREYLCLTITQK